MARHVANGWDASAGHSALGQLLSGYLTGSLRENNWLSHCWVPMQIQAEWHSLPPLSRNIVISISASGRGVWFLLIRVSLRTQPSAAPLTHSSYAVLKRCRDGCKRSVHLCLYSYTTQICMPEGQLHRLQKNIDFPDKPTGSRAAKAIVQWWIFFWIRHSACGLHRENLSWVQKLTLCHSSCMLCVCVCVYACIFVCKHSAGQRCMWACPVHMNKHSVGWIWWKIASALTSHFILSRNAEWMKSYWFYLFVGLSSGWKLTAFAIFWLTCCITNMV